MTRLNIPLFVALAASLLAAIDARTNTLPHQRMIRKRAPGPGPVVALPRWENFQERADIPGLGNNDPSGSASSATASRTSASATASASDTKAASSSTAASDTSTSAAASNTASASVANTSSASSTSSGGLLDSLTGLLGGTSTSSTVSSTSTTSSSSIPLSTAKTSAAPTTSQPPAPATTPSPTLNLATTPAPSNTPSQSVAVITSIAPEAAASQQAEQKARTAKITKNTIISLVVIASCIGGAVAIWTVIRKWKLSPSERFDDRMQPIDWAPTGGAGMREETMEEKRHRRAGSAGSHGSFTSGGVGQSELGHGTGARSVYSDHTGHNMQQAQDFPPAHDFTAGAANYGQYHQGQQYGYADLQRGPSVTESNYSHGASVTRGLSYSRGGSGGYEAQPGAGGVPPLPNPYGGGYEYEEYGRQQGQGQGQYRAY